MRITIILAVLISFSLLFGFCGAVYAQGSTPSAAINLEDLGSINESGAIEVGESLISPVSPLYFLKAIREKIESFFGGSDEAKVIREIEFAHRRLRETRALVKNKNQDLIEPTLEKYQFHIRKAGELASKSEELQIKVGDAVARHLDVLQRVYDQVGNPRAKMAIRTAIERAEEHNQVLLEQLSLINQQKLIRMIALRQAQGCRFLQRETSSSALNDTEREYLKQKVGQCMDQVTGSLKDELGEILKNKNMKNDQATPSSVIR